MITEEQVRGRLEDVLVPGAMRSLVKLNLVRDIVLSNGNVEIAVASAALNSDSREWVRTKVSNVLKEMNEIGKVTVDFVEASPKEVNDIRNVVAVMSGKGGVGKSLVTGLAGVSLARTGYDVGILDGDITGPSIPRMFGLSGRPAGSDTGILPMLSRTGIEVMSINLLLDREDEAVVWRGPLIGKAITQFWEDVLWGKLDYLIVDLPPGTADAPLTVMQSLPLTGVVIVFSPQELAAMVVRKAMRMARGMNVPIVGVVENMSYFLVPETGKEIELFGESKAGEMARVAAAPLLGKFPIDPELARLCDNGEIERYHTEALNEFGEAFLRAVPALKE